LASPWTISSQGLLITIRLTPKGGRNALDGLETLSDGTVVLKARVRSVPEDGAANKALLKLLAATLSVPVSSLSIQSGHTSRLKRVLIEGDGIALSDLIQGVIFRMQ